MFLSLKHKKIGKNLVIVLGLLALIGFFTYSLIEYRKSGIAEDGIITCENGICFWSAHIHVNIPIQICGEQYILPKFKGALIDFHTHGNENIIHWHDKILFDAEKKQFLEPSPFANNLIFENLGLPITTDILLDKKDGDLCNGVVGTWKVFVNGVLDVNWRNYEWKDKDIVNFIFDQRSVEEVLKELRQNPLIFPNVGSG